EQIQHERGRDAETDEQPHARQGGAVTHPPLIDMRNEVVKAPRANLTAQHGLTMHAAIGLLAAPRQPRTATPYQESATECFPSEATTATRNEERPSDEACRRRVRAAGTAAAAPPSRSAET